MFRGAATADIVWETKLPDNYRYLIEKASEEGDSKRLGFLTKKDIYAELCRRNPFDEGTKVRKFEIFIGKRLDFFFNYFLGKIWNIVVNWGFGSLGFRNFGWRRKVVAFACRFRRKLWRLQGSTIGDIGIISQLRNLGIISFSFDLILPSKL